MATIHAIPRTPHIAAIHSNAFNLSSVRLLNPNTKMDSTITARGAKTIMFFFTCSNDA